MHVLGRLLPVLGGLALAAWFCRPGHQPRRLRGPIFDRLSALDRRVLGPPTRAERWRPDSYRELGLFLVAGRGPKRTRPSKQTWVVLAVGAAAQVTCFALHATLAGLVVLGIWYVAALLCMSRDARRQAWAEYRNEQAGNDGPLRPGV